VYRVTIPNVFHPPSSLGDSRIHIDRIFIAKWRTACLSRVADLLLNAQDERLRRCKNCGKLFLAVKRQEYCTLRCSQTRRTRRHREKNPEKASEQRHRAYKRSMERKVGGKVKIQRRGPRQKN
jgi:hypothetical protein